MGKDLMKHLNIWTVYQDNPEFPGQFLARRFENDRETVDHYAHTELEKVRMWVRDQATRLGACPVRFVRSVCEEPTILETWL